MVIIDDPKIRNLERLIIEKFNEFKKLYRETYSEDISDDLDKQDHIDPIWTCYINGKGKGYEVRNWDGIFSKWIKPCLTNEEIRSEGWYRIDRVIVDNTEGGWWTGKYRIILAFEQENNPEEIKGHTRQFYDFNVPQKILLIWTNLKHSAPDTIMHQAEDVITYCKAKGIINAGEIIIIVGDWEKFKQFNRKPRMESKDFIFTIKRIPSSLTLRSDKTAS